MEFFFFWNNYAPLFEEKGITTFSELMLHIDDIRKKRRLTVVAYLHNTGGPLITIDLVAIMT